MNSSLDFLRGIAVLLILGRHFRLGNTTEHCFPILIWNKIGSLGVDLFFTLSGFLIGSLLFRELIQTGRVRTGRFLVRRGFKIYPSYYIYLLVFLFLHSNNLLLPPTLNQNFAFSYPKFLRALLFTQNYTGLISSLYHTWSLALEEHFYFLIATLFWCFSGRNIKHIGEIILGLTAFLLLLCLGLRIHQAHRVVYDWATHTTYTHLRIDALMFGVCLAYLSQYHGELYSKFCRNHRNPLRVAGGLIFFVLPLVLPPVEQTPFLYPYLLTASLLGSGIILMATSGSKALGATGPGKLLANIGRDSYAIYLWHLMAQALVMKVTGRPVMTDLGCLVYVATACVVGKVLASAFEKPFLKLRDRVFQDPKPAPVLPLVSYEPVLAQGS